MIRTKAFGEHNWCIPIAYATAAVILGTVFPRLESRYLSGLLSSVNSAAAIAVLSSVASGMMALTGIVFSMAFVMMQFNATAYSPRLVLWLARDPFVFHAIGIFTATFLYALAGLLWIDRNNVAKVPILTGWVAILLLLASVVALARLVQRLGLLKISNVLSYIDQCGRRVIAEMYPGMIVDRPSVVSTASAHLDVLPRITQVVVHRGAPRLIGAFELDPLLKLAVRSNALIELTESVGEAAMDGAPLLLVRGGVSILPEKDLRKGIILGPERTFEQDPKYAIRLLVDIAIKSLSPAINDPTTAVQALDFIEDLLRSLGQRDLQAGRIHDDSGTLRIMFPVPTWPDFASLALEEIRYYGSNSIQVMRRMRAMLRDLMADLPPERQPALRIHLDRIDSRINRVFAFPDERVSASMEDRQGLGMTRR